MKTSKLFLIVVLVLVGAFAAQATTNYNETVSPINRIGKLAYHGAVTMTTAKGLTTSDIYYTQAAYVGAVNASDALARFVCSEVGTEDVNVFIEYSLDAATWVAGTTDLDLDAVGTTAVLDTIGQAEKTNEQIYHTYMFIRFKLVPGATVGNGLVLTWSAAFIKPAGLERVQVDLVKDTPTP